MVQTTMNEAFMSGVNVMLTFVAFILGVAVVLGFLFALVCVGAFLRDVTTKARRHRR